MFEREKIVFGSEAERLKCFWNTRYNRFSLEESGIKGLGKQYIPILYQCKVEAYLKAIKIGRIKVDQHIKILDAGCGQGFFAEQAFKIFLKVDYTGVDISDKVINHLKSFQTCKWINQDFCSPDFDIGQDFNIVQSIEVLHLILDDKNHFNAIRNLSKCLAPDGILIITDVLPRRKMAVGGYMVFRERSCYEDICLELNLEIVQIFPMYYWVPDRGIRIFPFKYLFYLVPPSIIFRLDRLFLKLKMPQILPSHDSLMKMLVIRKK